LESNDPNRIDADIVCHAELKQRKHHVRNRVAAGH